LIRDEHYVHAAIRKVGLGQIGFISFPVGALDQNDPRSQQLWRSLLGVDAPQLAWNTSALADRQRSFITRMIGKSVTPWSLAAGIVGGYLLLVLAAHVALNGIRRPSAFAVTVAVAVLGTIGMIVASMVKSEAA